MLSVIKGIQPRDQIESMLAAQMAAVHSATMVSARVLGRADTIAKLDSAERAFNKLARTFTTQMEALKRYRSGGEQKVTVQHVSVSDGGQAIVGHVTHAPREPSPAPAPPAKMAPAALTQSQEAPMPLIVEAQPAAPTATKPSNARPRWGPKK